MPFSSNFTTASIIPFEHRPVLLVSGQSSPGAARAIYALVNHGGELLSTEIDDPHGASWRVIFEADPPFAAGTQVALTGVALLEEGDKPFFWQSTLTIEG